MGPVHAAQSQSGSATVESAVHATSTTPAPAKTAGGFAYREFFNGWYTEADGDAGKLPWEDQKPNPALVAWMNAVAPQVVRCGARVLVVGCGLGNDARELMNRGYDVTAFDVSAKAVEWARTLDPERADLYHEADLFNPPAKWRHRFDLAVEIYTVQSLPPVSRVRALKAIRELIHPRGAMLLIARGTEAPAPIDAGPPWPFTKDELLEATRAAGFALDGDLHDFMDEETPPKRRFRGLFAPIRS